MKIPAAIATFLLLPGCAHWFGPAHGYFDAVGTTPGADSCLLSVLPVGSKHAPTVWAVSGSFKQSVVVSPSRRGHRITLSCAETVVADRVFKYGHDVRLGGELIVNDSAP